MRLAGSGGAGEASVPPGLQLLLLLCLRWLQCGVVCRDRPNGDPALSSRESSMTSASLEDSCPAVSSSGEGNLSGGNTRTQSLKISSIDLLTVLCALLVLPGSAQAIYRGQSTHSYVHSTQQVQLHSGSPPA